MRHAPLLAACLAAAVLGPAGSFGQPLPQERPNRAGEPNADTPAESSEPVSPADGAPADEAATSPGSVTGAPAAAPLQRPAPPPLPALPGATDVAADAASETACRERLKTLGVVFRPQPPIAGQGGCGVAAPVAVSVLAPGVALTPEATLNCTMAEATARWTQTVVIPAAKAHLGAKLSGMAQASTYVCRPRNNRPSGKLSEHATANAIDIGALTFEGRAPVAVVGDGGTGAPSEQAFRRAIRAGACAHFTTVLGPGSDAAHGTHFHFDLARRKNDYKLCQ